MPTTPPMPEVEPNTHRNTSDNALSTSKVTKLSISQIPLLSANSSQTTPTPCMLLDSSSPGYFSDSLSSYSALQHYSNQSSLPVGVEVSGTSPHWTPTTGPGLNQGQPTVAVNSNYLLPANRAGSPQQPAHTQPEQYLEVNTPVASSHSESTRSGCKRVILKTDEEKAKLVRLCINNFSRYAEGKDKFFSGISKLYQEADPGGSAPNAKAICTALVLSESGKLRKLRGKVGLQNQSQSGSRLWTTGWSW